MSLRVGRRTVAVSNPDKVLFPGDGITKGELVEHYRQVAVRMLPHVRGRPVSMERYPNGIDGERVFQKGAPAYFPPWIARATVPKKGGSVSHVVVDQAATLVYMANQACITPHVALSRADRLQNPDQLIFDLDPWEDFEEARHAALLLKPLLDELALPSFVKTTGGKGLHVTVPIDGRADFDEVHDFAGQVGAELVRRDPDRLTMEFRKANREGRLYVDLLRNRYAQTAAPPYAVRARPGATVATPLNWSEVEDRRLRPDRFTVRTIFDRLERVEDPWRGMARQARSLDRARRRLEVARVTTR